MTRWRKEAGEKSEQRTGEEEEGARREEEPIKTVEESRGGEEGGSVVRRREILFACVTVHDSELISYIVRLLVRSSLTVYLN